MNDNELMSGFSWQMPLKGWLGPVGLVVLVTTAKETLSLRDGSKAYRLSVSSSDGSVLCAQVNSASYPRRDAVYCVRSVKSTRQLQWVTCRMITYRRRYAVRNIAVHSRLVTASTTAPTSTHLLLLLVVVVVVVVVVFCCCI